MITLHLFPRHDRAREAMFGWNKDEGISYRMSNLEIYYGNGKKRLFRAVPQDADLKDVRQFAGLELESVIYHPELRLTGAAIQYLQSRIR